MCIRDRVQIDYTIRQQAKNAEKKQARDLTVFAAGPQDRRDPQRAAHLKEALAEERLIGVLLKNPDYCRLILEKITPEDFLTDFNREIFRVICERLAQNRSVELIALSEQLSEEQMGKVAGILADPASSCLLYTSQLIQKQYPVVGQRNFSGPGDTSAAG